MHSSRSAFHLSSELALSIRWTKYWSFSFSVTPFNDYSGLILFRIVCFDLFVVQGTLKSLLQHHSSKASILWCSAFFMVQLSHLYVTAGKTIALTVWTSVRKVISLLFNRLSRFVISLLSRSKHLFISWLQSPSAVILEPTKTKSITVSIFSPCICHEVMEPVAMILVFWMLSFKPAFSLSSFTLNKRLFSPFSLSAIRMVSSDIWGHRRFFRQSWFQLVIISSLAFWMMKSAYKLNIVELVKNPPAM